MSSTTQVEIERKYDVDGETAVPELTEVPGIATVVVREPVTLDAVYYDTDGLHLAAHRVVLRRREGGGDEGWHIKKPASEGRTEIHWPLGEKNVIPDAVLEPIRVLVRDRELTPLATISTVRTAYHLLDESGEAVAELADDLVTASDARNGTVRVWREWEVELLPAAPDTEEERTRLLDEVEAVLGAAGGHPSTSIAKIARALGADSLTAVPGATGDGPDGSVGSDGPDGFSDDSPAGDVIVAAIGSLVAALHSADPLVRANEPDSVHRMRTVVRRLRSVLASYRRLFDRESTDDLRDRLKRLGAALGEARDAEVRGLRAEDLVTRIDSEFADAAAGVRLTGDAADEYAAAHARVLALLSGGAYYRLLDALDEFVAHPLFTVRAARPVAKEVSKALDHELQRLRSRADAADEGEGDHDIRLHAVRRAARRLRYAAEAVSNEETSNGTALGGKKAKRLARAAEAVQDALGDHRDNTLFAQHLALTSNRAHAAGEKTFVYGLLYEWSGKAADAALAESEKPLDKLR